MLWQPQACSSWQGLLQASELENRPFLLILVCGQDKGRATHKSDQPRNSYTVLGLNPEAALTKLHNLDSSIYFRAIYTYTTKSEDIDIPAEPLNCIPSS